MPLSEFSPVIAGVWRMASWEWSVAERVRWIEQCLEAGVTTFDHADIYGGYSVEALFGEALAAAPELKARVKLVTKCGIHLLNPSRPDTWIKHYDSSGRHIVASVERSLKNLGVDQLDLLLLHRPDSLMDVDEVAQAFDALRAAGKVAAFGVSNFTPSQFALLYSQTPLVTNQIEWHPLHLAPLFDGTLDQAQQLRPGQHAGHQQSDRARQPQLVAHHRRQHRHREDHHDVEQQALHRGSLWAGRMLGSPWFRP